MSTLGFVRVGNRERARVERTEPHLRRLALRRDGNWLTFADSASRASFGEALSELDAWGEHLSRVLSRSVLAIWTWDGEASVRVTRWKKGKARCVLSLLHDAYRGADAFVYAPARVLWPWLPPDRRDAILREGVKLVTPSGGSTGDAEVDALLEGFDDADRLASEGVDDEHVFVSEGVSVAALSAAVGMRDPFLDPSEPRDEDAELLFRPRVR